MRCGPQGSSDAHSQCPRQTRTEKETNDEARTRTPPGSNARHSSRRTRPANRRLRRRRRDPAPNSTPSLAIGGAAVPGPHPVRTGGAATSGHTSPVNNRARSPPGWRTRRAHDGSGRQHLPPRTGNPSKGMPTRRAVPAVPHQDHPSGNTATGNPACPAPSRPDGCARPYVRGSYADCRTLPARLARHHRAQEIGLRASRRRSISNRIAEISSRLSSTSP